ncbi:MAG: hypothetical protein SchgKO_07550 [Schleiferiaceae bacterium]
MITTEKFRKFGWVAMLFSAVVFTSCDDDDDVVAPPIENEEEIITDLKLIFTNTMDSTDVVMAAAQDPDGEGVMELEILDSIYLSPNVTYTLTMEIFNNLETPGEDIGAEIEEEADEHQIFFSFTDGAFSDPMGDGNFDDYADPVNYNDFDVNNLPVGLNTTWTTGSNSVSMGSFRIRLQHQPDGIKQAGSTVNDGDTDFDLDFELYIQ